MKEQILKLYVEEKLSLTRIALLLGYTERAIRNLLKNSNIEIRHQIPYSFVPGEKFGPWTITNEKRTYKDGRTAWLCICECGVNTYIREYYLRYKKYKGCGHGIKYPTYELVNGEYWGDLERGAKKRGITFDITPKFGWELYLKQNRLCALSGLVIVLNPYNFYHKLSRLQTASLDRIDSNIGYIESNVQWIHKTLNVLKSTMTVDELLFWCNQIADYHRT